MDKKPLPEELLPDDVDYSVDPPPLTDEQRRELQTRLEHHRRHPDEPTVTLDEICHELFGSSG
jgi:hypothetical protein